MVNDQLFCNNKQCPAQTLKKVQHFAKTLKIKGLGEKTIEKLGMESVLDIYGFSKYYYIDVLGEKVGTKIFQEVEDSKNSSLAEVLEAFSIPLVGGTVAKKVASVVEHISEISEQTCKLAGLGQKATANLLLWLATDLDYVHLPFTYESKKDTVVPTGKTVCITGKLVNYKSRETAKSYLESLGYVVVDSVTSKTNILIDEEGKSSSKREKAEKLNIPILTIQELIQGNI